MSLMTNEDLKHAIESSFLDEQSRKDAIERLESEGMTAAFLETLRKAMIDEIERRGDVVREEMARFDEEIAALDAETQEKSARDLAALTVRLEELSPSDMPAKGRLWDEYYLTRERQQAEYVQAIKAKISDMIARLA